jgi:hypothetical protein
LEFGWQHFRDEGCRRTHLENLEHPNMSTKKPVSSGLILHKAIDRYYRDAESRGTSVTEHPIAVPARAVDEKNRVVTLEGKDGPLATYAYTLTRTGYLRFRPEW